MRTYISFYFYFFWFRLVYYVNEKHNTKIVYYPANAKEQPLALTTKNLFCAISTHSNCCFPWICSWLDFNLKWKKKKIMNKTIIKMIRSVVGMRCVYEETTKIVSQLIFGYFVLWNFFGGFLFILVFSSTWKVKQTKQNAHFFFCPMNIHTRK